MAKVIITSLGLFETLFATDNSPVHALHIPTYYSGQFLAFLKSCQTQDKFPNFLRDLQDSKNFEFFLLFFSFQPEKVVNFTTKVELITC